MFKKTKLVLAFSFILGATGFCTAQEGRVTIDQDERIAELLKIKTRLTQSSRLGDRYKIQLFYGDITEATEVIKKYRGLYPEWPASIEYETPNYKVWVGNFRNSLQADHALLKIKETFPAAFRLRPER